MTNDQGQSVLCSFCDKGFASPKAMGNHLMLCGNKTDQCPNCRKYIRRAIFAYHCKNNCADLVDPTTEDETYQKPQYSNKLRVTVPCPFCNQNHDRADSRIHKKNCLRNPENVAKQQQQSMYENYNRSPDRSHQIDASKEDDLIPCEYCNKEISWHHYESHTRVCSEEEYKRQQHKARCTNQSVASTTGVSTTASITSSASCKFCQKSMSLAGIAYHQLICIKNIHRNKN